MIIPILPLVQNSLMVTEVADPNAGRMLVQIVAGIDRADRKEWAAANALREALYDGTIGFTAMDLLTYATLGGDAFRITLAPDHIRIGYSVPTGDVKLAVRLADDWMRDALLSESSVKAALDELPFRKRTPWSEVWNPIAADSNGVVRADVVRLYRKVFRPDNVSIAVGGSVLPGQARREFGERFASWRSTATSAGTFRDKAPSSIDRRTGRLATVRLEGPDVRLIPIVGGTGEGASPNLGTAVLACSMLGQGKGSTLYRVLREGLGISYRQEAFLTPTPSGIRPVVAFASANAKAVELDFKAPLLRDIDAWTDSDRVRALALAKTDVDLDLGLGNLYFAEDRPLTQSLVDRTFLAAYWRLKTGRSWSWQTTFAEMDSVTVEAAKAYAKAWIENGRISSIVPR